jgi:hypothetical protein
VKYFAAVANQSWHLMISNTIQAALEILKDFAIPGFLSCRWHFSNLELF